MSHESHAASLGGLYPENPILVLSASSGEATAEEQRQIYRSAADGLSEGILASWTATESAPGKSARGAGRKRLF
jgi:hypothetical protein